ncbi:MAG: septum formation initiator family protein [Firmicutes bacterium]|nr:septum formation initiator family protein [Bacillota bacterium]
MRQERRMRILATRYEELLRRQQELQADNERLQGQIQRLLEDPAYLERLAREMGMVKPGDTIYLSSDPHP